MSQPYEDYSNQKTKNPVFPQKERKKKTESSDPDTIHSDVKIKCTPSLSATIALQSIIHELKLNFTN